MSLKDDLERGSQAAGLVASPAFQAAFASVEQAIHDLWAACPVRDLEGQQLLRLQLPLLGDVRAALESAIEDGKSAQEELERLNRRVITPREWKGNTG